MDNLKSWYIIYQTGETPLDAVMFDRRHTHIYEWKPKHPMIELLYQARKMDTKSSSSQSSRIGHVIRWTTEQLRNYRIPYDYLDLRVDTKGLMKIIYLTISYYRLEIYPQTHKLRARTNI